jgi:hypothetical protein
VLLAKLCFLFATGAGFVVLKLLCIQNVRSMYLLKGCYKFCVPAELKTFWSIYILFHKLHCILLLRMFLDFSLEMPARALPRPVLIEPAYCIFFPNGTFSFNKPFSLDFFPLFSVGAS